MASESSSPMGFVATEYAALQAAILQRMQMQYQLIGVVAVAAGTFIGLGVGSQYPSMVLVVPPVTLLFAAAWAHLEILNRSAREYIRVQIEARFFPVNSGFEHAVERSRVGSWVEKAVAWAPVAILVGIQIIGELASLLAAYLRGCAGVRCASVPIWSKILFVFDVVVIVVTLVFLVVACTTRPSKGRDD